MINETYDQNFNNYINSFRIKEARHLLTSKSYNNYSLEGIADMCGFNSMVSFNSAFKKFTGITPSYFQKSQQNMLDS
ncbi:MAG: AraC family transcriptional regulator [Bacteroidales bacterium]|nr:AraC family transcriptional regulator [Bacteroidales bacterium]